MKFVPHLALLLTAASLHGCSFLGIGDDEAPLGPPTQIAFSLYASPEVNPNANIHEVEASAIAAATPVSADVDERAPYQISLTGNDQLDMIDKLNALLEHLQSTGPGNAPARLEDSVPFDPSLQIPHGSPVPPPLSRIADFEALPQRLYDIPLPPHSIEGRAPSWLSDAWQHSDASQTASPVGPDTPVAKAVATPITFKILQLKDDSLFLNADHDLLTKSLKKALGKTYLDDDDYILLPGQFKFIDYAEIDEDTRYLAVFANFHDQDRAVWKQVIRLEPNGHRYALLVTLHDTAVAITEERYRLPQPRPMK